MSFLLPNQRAAKHISKTVLVFFTLSIIKVLAKTFFRFEEKWLSPFPPNWNQIKCIGVLNHTSLFEPIFVAIYPFSQLWRAAKQMVAPAADITMNRKFVGMIFSLLGQNIIPISRKRDSSWETFLDLINEQSLVVILPEGRMMRKGGLDKNGKKMDIRPGIADVISKIPTGKLMIVTSGGLHHIQRPGQIFPKLFKKVKVVVEIHDISHLKGEILSQIANKNSGLERTQKKLFVEFLEDRKKDHLNIMS
jgi:1-acyl-sn-glycerol-3-phosphate acyltransferase